MRSKRVSAPRPQRYQPLSLMQLASRMRQAAARAAADPYAQTRADLAIRRNIQNGLSRLSFMGAPRRPVPRNNRR